MDLGSVSQFQLSKLKSELTFLRKWQFLSKFGHEGAFNFDGLKITRLVKFFELQVINNK